MSKRLKSSTAIETRAQFDTAVDECCHLQLDLEKLVVKRDKQLAKIREEHDPEIERITEQMRAKVVLCEKYATTHKDTLFGRAKSAAASLGIFGFRTGNPTLKLLNRKWKWDDVVNAIKSSDRLELLRVKTEANKDALKQLPDEEQAKFGVRTEQEETFFIEPKRDDPQRITAD